MGYTKICYNLKLLSVARIILFGSILIHYSHWLFEDKIFLFYPNAKVNYIFDILYISVFFGAFFSVIGLHTRIAHTVVLISHSTIVLSNAIMFWGWGKISIVLVLLHIFTPNDFYFSAVKRSRRRQQSFLFFYFLIAFISVVYFAANILRFYQTDWLSGNVLIYGLLDPMYSRFASLNFFKIKFFLAPLSIAGWILELAGVLLFLLPLRGLRKVIAFGLLVLHMAILIFFKVQMWSPIMFSGLILCFGYFQYDTKNFSFKSLKILGITTFFFLFFSSYVYLVNFSPSSKVAIVLKPVFKTLFLDTILKSYPFLNSSHSVGAVYDVYAKSKNEYLKLKTQYNVGDYLGLNFKSFPELVPEMLERVFMRYVSIKMEPESIKNICYKLEKLFEKLYPEYILRRTALIHFEGKSGYVEYSEKKITCGASPSISETASNIIYDKYENEIVERFKSLDIEYDSSNKK